MKKINYSIISAITFFIVWEALGRYINKGYILPTPLNIIKKIWILKESLFMTHLPVTFLIAGISLILTMGLGIFLASAMDLSKIIYNCIHPLIVTSQTIPITALAPIFILWFGYSIWSKIIVSVMISFFPVTITIYNGLQNINQSELDYFKSLKATKTQIFFKLKIPTALPNLFSAFKMSIPLVLIGAAIGEWLGATAGLGYFSKRMMSQLDGAGVFAPIFILSSLAILLVRLIGYLENKILHWRKK
ncbi:ABC transporter permease [Candidatus Cetobacterium colombiensis]|uniref:ABC transporter permease n=1 Tax=Candidatus Cetobacterium colombiensis TaxID=3073100 RepID=A0ABU4W720_9FUSO|nr:ABC transporter permease [Candidatus Cetobacterium colombiensis]MDX8335322.1 ABC transporter permease [Candidatus Cetobacterium colombiensis]